MFHYNVDEVPREFNSYLYHLACSKIYFNMSLKVTEPIDEIEDLLNTQI